LDHPQQENHPTLGHGGYSMGFRVFFLLLDDDSLQMYGDSHPELDRI